MKQKKPKRILFWLVLFCVGAVLGGFYIKNRIGTSKLPAYISKEVPPPAPSTGDKIPSQTASPKPPSVSSTKGKFTFFPDDKDRYVWSVKYPDGRTFKLGEDFSGDCPPAVGQAKVFATIRFKFNQQRSCKSGARKPVKVPGELMKDVSGHGSPEVISTILTGGNVYGHTSALISLTPMGPKVVRRLN